jgi:Zn-finger domain-containing protein
MPVSEIPRIYILWDLLHYYLTTSYDRRNKYSGPFPYLRPELDSNQIKDSRTSRWKQLISFMNILGKLEYIPHMANVLSSKFSVERR